MGSWGSITGSRGMASCFGCLEFGTIALDLGLHTAGFAVAWPAAKTNSAIDSASY